MKSTTCQLTIAACLMLGSTAVAVPTTVSGIDTPGCDVLSVPTVVDELGTNVFPANELIASQYLGVTNLVACPTSDLSTPNHLVQITNLTATTWQQVWYVANPSTMLTNDDGPTNGMHSFLINNLAVDMNSPLISESGPVDNMLQPGETWQFVIDDYTNQFGLAPDQFGQIGVPDTLPIPPIASGNIIAAPLVPEPSGALLLAAGACALLARRRR
jgi:hypothetical protein